MLKEQGLDILDISGGLCSFRPPVEPVQGFFSPVSRAIAERVDIPIILTGGITQPQAACRLIEEGAADLIGVGRALLRDSLWAKNAMESLGG